MGEMSQNNRELVFDIETDGLIDDGPKGAGLTKIHCIGAIDVETDEEFLFEPSEVEEGLAFLSNASRLIGHNIIQFDQMAIRKVYPKWTPPVAVPFDTMVAAKLIWPGDVLWELDSKLVAKGILPGNLRKRYSLKAFGYRLGENKGGYGEETENAWETYTPEMGDYCLQDCRVQLKLYRKIREKSAGVPEKVFDLEMQVQEIMYHQEKAGFWFNHEKAVKLLAELQNRQALLERRLLQHFQPWVSPVWDIREDRLGNILKDQSGRALKQVKVETVRRTRNVKLPEYPDVTVRRYGKNGKELKPYVGPPVCVYVEGSQYCPLTINEFNPSSRQHVADRLETIFGWKPVEYTKDGLPKLDETILKALPYEPCGDLVEYFVTTKIIGMLAQGGQSWLSNYNEKTHRIHGRMDALGTITGRASHSNPNIGQTPSVVVR